MHKWAIIARIIYALEKIIYGLEKTIYGLEKTIYGLERLFMAQKDYLRLEVISTE